MKSPLKSPFTILVIEDRHEHFNDFRKMFDEIGEKLPIRINVLRAACLHTAIELLPQADAVISDLFFPEFPCGEEQPNGRKVVERCLELKKPVVWITSTYHHGPATNEHSQWGRKRGLEMFDCKVDAGATEAPHKPWLQALFGVLALVVGLDDGDFKIEEGKILSRSPFERDSFELLGPTLQAIACDIAAPQEPTKLKMLQMGFARIHES